MLPNKTLLIGLATLVIVSAASGATWWFSLQNADDSLASRLPADGVLAYAEFPADSISPADLFAVITPTLPPPPAIDATVTAIAAVRMPEGTIAWRTFPQADDGTARIDGPTLAQERTFRTLRPEAGTSWAYLAYPRLSSDDSPFAPVLALQTPIAVLDGGRGPILRIPLQPTPRLTPRADRPLVNLPNLDVRLFLPSAHALERLGTLLTPQARMIAEALAASFLEEFARSLSLRYDASLLLDEPSLFQAGKDSAGGGVFSLEGNGRTTADTDRILRALHGQFAATRGGAKVLTVTTEGLTLRTLTQQKDLGTTERRDGTWTILETRTDDASLASAHDGTRFVLTSAPDLLFNRPPEISPDDVEPSFTPPSILRWNDALTLRLQPLVPDWTPDGEVLGFRLAAGPGYVEWSLEGVRIP